MATTVASACSARWSTTAAEPESSRWASSTVTIGASSPAMRPAITRSVSSRPAGVPSGGGSAHAAKAPNGIVAVARVATTLTTRRPSAWPLTHSPTRRVLPTPRRPPTTTGPTPAAADRCTSVPHPAQPMARPAAASSDDTTGALDRHSYRFRPTTDQLGDADSQHRDDGLGGHAGLCRQLVERAPLNAPRSIDRWSAAASSAPLEVRPAIHTRSRYGAARSHRQGLPSPRRDRQQSRRRMMRWGSTCRPTRSHRRRRRSRPRSRSRVRCHGRWPTPRRCCVGREPHAGGDQSLAEPLRRPLGATAMPRSCSAGSPGRQATDLEPASPTPRSLHLVTDRVWTACAASSSGKCTSSLGVPSRESTALRMACRSAAVTRSTVTERRC